MSRKQEGAVLNGWTVYILECADGSLYTGITNDLASRISAHENGTGAKYTRGRAPFKLVYKEECDSRSHASKREREIKSLKRAEKRKIYRCSSF
ncbi:MAG: GIY-YIG nuclease family protein [Micavibrio sp.]|nr:MAG: GIY-YIG nuclease family protein [Micavibrio sp.]